MMSLQSFVWEHNTRAVTFDRQFIKTSIEPLGVFIYLNLNNLWHHSLDDGKDIFRNRKITFGQSKNTFGESQNTFGPSKNAF